MLLSKLLKWTMLNVRARACKCLHASRPFEGDPSPAWIRSVRVQQIPPMGGGEFSFDSLGGGDRASLTICICLVLLSCYRIALLANMSSFPYTPRTITERLVAQPARR